MDNVIKDARTTARMTQAMLAGAARVSRRTVQRAERGSPVSHESMRSICAVLGLDSTSTYVPVHAPIQSTTRVPPASLASPLASPVYDFVLLALSAAPVAFLLLAMWRFNALIMPRVPYTADAWLDGFRRVQVATYVAGSLPMAMAGRLAWRSVQGAALAVPAPFGGRKRDGLAFPVLGWRSLAGLSLRTWPGAALALLLLPAVTFVEWAPGLPSPSSLVMGSGGLAKDPPRSLVPTWRVDPTTPLGRAGLRVGDVVVRLDGHDVEDLGDLGIRAMSLAGRTVDVVVERPVGSGVALATLRVDVDGKSRMDSPARWGSLGDMTGLGALDRRPDLGRAMVKFLRRIPAFTATAVGLNGPDAVLLVGDRRTAYDHAYDWSAWFSIGLCLQRAEVDESLFLALLAFAFVGWSRLGPGLRTLVRSVVPTLRGAGHPFRGSHRGASSFAATAAGPYGPDAVLVRVGLTAERGVRTIRTAASSVRGLRGVHAAS